MSKKGSLVIISGFSGAGKGTVVKELMKNYECYALSISATTRNPRPGEENGREYFFKTKEEFEELINGKSIIKKIAPELTYREMNFKSSKDMNDNVYSFLLFTGYLKKTQVILQLVTGKNIYKNNHSRK